VAERLRAVSLRGRTEAIVYDGWAAAQSSEDERPPRKRSKAKPTSEQAH
jgi:hypothetical protein